jgi:hypothetical protein
MPCIYTKFTPQREECEIYDELYALFRRMYFDFGKPRRESCFGDVLPKLIQIARVPSGPQPQVVMSVDSARRT